MKITKSVRNISLIEIHNFCILNDCELDVANEEIIMLEVKDE